MSATQPSSTDLVAFINEPARRAEIARALPEDINADRFERMTQTAIIRNPELLKADRASLWLALLGAAQAGLVPDGKQAAIVVYGKTATLIPMIGGVRDILADFGWTLQTSVIYANDDFAADLGSQRIVHNAVRPGGDRGDIDGAYAQAFHRDGRRMVEVMSVTDINYVRDKSSRAAQNGPWKDWWTRMAEKTVGHRLAKKLSLDQKDKERISRVLAAEELEPAAATEMLYGGHQVAPTGEILEHSASSETTEQGAPSGENTPSGDIDHPAGAPDHTVEIAAIKAALFPADTGRYGPDREGGALNIGEIYGLPDGEGTAYIATSLLRKLPAGEFRDQVDAFAAHVMPAEYAAALAEREEL